MLMTAPRYTTVDSPIGGLLLVGGDRCRANGANPMSVNVALDALRTTRTGGR